MTKMGINFIVCHFVVCVCVSERERMLCLVGV